MIDLWPETLVSPEVKSPSAILREQASLLGKKTQDKIIADVELGETKTQEFVYHFYLIAPSLNNYYFRLFSVTHDISLYPVTLYLGEDLGQELHAIVDANNPSNKLAKILAASGMAKVDLRYELQATTESEFTELLGEILRSQKTQQVINALLAQIDTHHLNVPF